MFSHSLGWGEMKALEQEGDTYENPLCYYVISKPENGI